MVPTPELTLELFSEIFDTNVQGLVLLTKSPLPLIPSGGRITFLSMTAARQASSGAPPPRKELDF